MDISYNFELKFAGVICGPALPELHQLFKKLLHSLLTMDHIVPCTNTHGSVGHLLLTNNCMQKLGEEKELPLLVPKPQITSVSCSTKKYDIHILI